MKVNLINIGCFKNLVDCERLMWQLQMLGVDVVFGLTETDSDIVIVNTCGFISDAEKDSVALLLDIAKRKRKGQCSQFWVMGCYGQKMGDEIMRKIPEVDKVYGNFNWNQIVFDIGNKSWLDCTDRMLTTPRHYAYVKISEGCNMPCAYCIKPILNGPLKSEPIEKIVDECRTLARMGVKELQIVSQNTTDYGRDLYHKPKIAELIDRISDIEGIEWIRLHYAYPSNFPKDLIDVIASKENVCNYLDMAIQHCNEEMLRIMRRPMSKERLVALLDELKSHDISIRTTVMTGHPGESEEIYQELKEFIKQRRFDRLGVFPYSHETRSYSGKHYEDSIPETVKRERALELMAIQREIYNESNLNNIGKRMKIIIDGKTSAGCYEGRPENSTPMADPKIIITTDRPLVPGEFYEAVVTKSLGKDMEGTI